MASIGFLGAVFKENTKLLRSRLRVHPKISFRGCGNEKPLEDHSETMDAIRSKMMNRLGLHRSYNPNPKARDHLLQYQPKLEDLPPRSMQDSFTHAFIPLSQSKFLQDRYVGSMGRVRYGRLMEDMDLFAVWICHLHLKTPSLAPKIPLPYTFVTILVDKIIFTDFSARANLDIRISGHVTWVGFSSMEIVVWLEQLDEGKYKRITRALFLMAARNANNTKAAPVNPLRPATEREQLLWSGGQKRKERRKKVQASSLLTVAPTEEEHRMMHNLFTRTVKTNTMQLKLNSRILPKNARWMRDTSTVSTMPSFPENRNAQNTIFGGFLMRCGLETAWMCATLYCSKRPQLQRICDVKFQHPVSVFSFLKITATVVYTEEQYMQVMTIVDVIDPVTSEEVTTNTFNYTYMSSSKVPEVLPQSYDETLCYIEGRRLFKYAMEVPPVP